MSNKKDLATTNFRNSTIKAIAGLRLANKKLVSSDMEAKKKTIASNRKSKKEKRRQMVSDKYTKISGLSSLKKLQPIGSSIKRKKSN